MAEVFLVESVRDSGFRKLFALKRILPHMAADRRAQEMFLDEARLAAELDHQNIVQVFESDSDHGVGYLTMEYLRGVDCAHLLEQVGAARPLPQAVALMICTSVAAGLHHAHEARSGQRSLDMVHRDVSPSNIMLTWDGAVKLLDFGIARASQRQAATTTGGVKGKPPYMSPEQVAGDSVDRRSDVYSLGVVIYELTTGCHPFASATTDLALLNRIVEGAFERPSRVSAGYPPQLERIVLRAMAADRGVRYPTALALGRELDAFARAEGLWLASTSLAAFLAPYRGAERAPDRTGAQLASVDTARPWLTGELETVPDRGFGGSAPSLVVDTGDEISGLEETMAEGPGGSRPRPLATATAPPVSLTPALRARTSRHSPPPVAPPVAVGASSGPAARPRRSGARVALLPAAVTLAVAAAAVAWVVASHGGGTLVEGIAAPIGSTAASDEIARARPAGSEVRSPDRSSGVAGVRAPATAASTPTAELEKPVATPRSPGDLRRAGHRVPRAKKPRGPATHATEDDEADLEGSLFPPE